jgi:hypothetical protein
VIRSRGDEYTELDASGTSTEGCKGEEDSRCHGKSGIEDGEGRVKGEERKDNRCIIYAREMSGNTGRGERGGARAHWSWLGTKLKGSDDGMV